MSLQPNRQSAVIAAAMACALTGVSARATPQQPQPVLPDVQKLGPQVGSRVPDFTLDQGTSCTRSVRSRILVDRIFEASPI